MADHSIAEIDHGGNFHGSELLRLECRIDVLGEKFSLRFSNRKSSNDDRHEA